MSVQTASRFFALLTLIALGGGVVIWIAWFRRSTWLADIRPVALRGALAIAATAMSGSLYYSEVVGFTPCRLCWYQRIGIYPMVLVLAVAVIGRRDDVRNYIWALAAVTAPISVYHWTLQTWPRLEGTSCDPAAPCAVRWVEQFGFVSIPVMALATAVGVSALVAAAGPPRGDRQHTRHVPSSPTGSDPS